MASDIIDPGRADRLISACRTTIGDNVRSITYFTRDDFDQLYLRSDLEQDADLTGFVDYESLGFDAPAAYHGSELGEYRFTIRVFDNGYLVRVNTSAEGVFVTTDNLTLRNFEEVARAITEVLSGD
jgi:hypothetical protein